VLKAVQEYGDLIRASIASAPNDHRLGANEAPPAIISAFIGSYMTNVLDEIEKRVAKGKYDELANANLKLDIHNKIPDVMLDNTDRNRTSPFAFTGNKFEVRAVGSSANCSQTMTVMNTIMAQQLIDFKAEVDKLIKGGESKDGALLRVIRQYITDSKKICFEGDGYSEAWAKEAKKRGLNNVKTTPYALDFLTLKKYKDVFIKNNILTERELDARYEIQNHSYVMKIDIEAKTLADLAVNQILPSALDYSNKLISNIKGLKEIGIAASGSKAQKEIVTDIVNRINAVKTGVDKLNAALAGAHKSKSVSDEAKYYCDKVKPLFDDIRDNIDSLELLVEDTSWPLPKYREMLFMR
jgi:glutamine synthetase